MQESHFLVHPVPPVAPISANAVHNVLCSDDNGQLIFALPEFVIYDTPVLLGRYRPGRRVCAAIRHGGTAGTRRAGTYQGAGHQQISGRRIEFTLTTRELCQRYIL